jgi:succinate dehydrogenase / fumarate reductase iron-sulfur subunit
MNVTLSVRRFNPDVDEPESYLQDYELEVDDTAMVLDLLIKVREEIDGTLALRCSCRSAICGSCAMRVNGQASLACNTNVADAASKGDGVILVEPMGNMQVVKDLVVDFKPFWDKVRAVEPWLKPEGPEPDPDLEYTAPNEDMLDLAGVMSCIMCGACVSDCTVLAVDGNFLGPAALAKAYRFVGDPRDDAGHARLGELNGDGGMWDCTRCLQCVEVCPKGVDPMGRIMSLRSEAMEAGYTKTYGARHANALTQMVEHSGRVDELRLPIKTKGMFNIPEMIKLIPVGLRAQRNGKVPPIIHKKNPGQEKVRSIFKKVERRE